MTEPRTIDNLGVNVSVDWARQQEAQKGIPLQEGQRVSAQIAVDVTTPSYVPEIQALVGQPGEFQPLASFSPPPNYNLESRAIFTDQLCPSLGSDEKKEGQISRIQQLIPDLPKGTAQPTREQEDRLKQKTSITSLLDLTVNYDKLSTDVNARKNQYQRG